MPDVRQIPQDQEPIGIVISRGRSIVTPPRLAAYIYGDVEEVVPAIVEPVVDAKVA